MAKQRNRATHSGQHRDLVAVQAQLKEGERLFPFLDDICVVCLPERIGEVCRVVEQQLWTRTGIGVHQGKTKLWNAGGCKPALADALSAAARQRIPHVVVWRGDHDLRVSQQGLTVLCVPVGPVAAEDGGTFKIVGEEPSSGGRPSALASLQLLRGHTSEFPVEDSAPRSDR